MTINKTLLIPNNSLEYYEDAIDITQKKYLRATSIRSCLENIVDTVFIHISGMNTEAKKVKGKWKRGGLSDKIKMLEWYFPDEIYKKIINIKELGNKGPHPKDNKLITDEAIRISLEDLSKICEWTILSYFKKYGFDIHPWLPTIFSTLPPQNRIIILESLFEDLVASLKDNDVDLKKYHDALTIKQKRCDIGDFLLPQEEELLFADITEESIQAFDQIHLIVDKLSMAYLKNNDFDKSISFINECHEHEIISDNFRDCMIIKMNEMHPHLDNFKISQDIEDTRQYYKELVAIVKEEDKTLFITIFTAVLAMH